MSKAWIQLGKRGDIYSIVPILCNEWKQTGQKQNLIVGFEFASCLHGIPYINPIIWKGKWIDLHGALKWAKQNFDDVVCLQVYGYEFPIQYKCPSFQLEHWRRGNYLNRWGELRAEVDRPKDAADLCQKHFNGEPSILFADYGNSSPMDAKNQIAEILRDKFGSTHRLVRLSEIRLPHETDLLALYDCAKCILTVDTMHLHLSVATQTPTLALLSDKPFRSNGSGYSTRFAWTCRYNDFEKRKDEMVSVISDILNGRKHEPKLIHLWSCGNNPLNKVSESDRRMMLARQTWQDEAWTGRWEDCKYEEDNFHRSAHAIGSKLHVPYIGDMIDFACRGRYTNDIVVLTNSDICFVPGLTQRILDTVSVKGAVFSYRIDFPHLDKKLTAEQAAKGSFYPGSDLFAFTVGWWKNYREDYPDMFLATERWDLLMRWLVKQTGGCELANAIYHERHPAFWKNNKNDPANVQNRKNSDEFVAKWGLADSDWKDKF